MTCTEDQSMAASTRKPYPTDVTDAQWSLLEPLLRAFEDRVRPGPAREVDLREVVNKYHNHAYEGWLRANSRGRWRMAISSRPADAVGFKPLPIRWVVERTFAWLGRYRRHSKDYERRTDSSESMLLLSMMGLLLHRLRPPAAKNSPFRYRKAS